MSQSLAHWLRVLREAPTVGGGHWRRLPGTLLSWRDATPFVRIHLTVTRGPAASALTPITIGATWSP